MFFGLEERAGAAKMLRAELDRVGMSQADAAASCGLSQSAISKVLNARTVKSTNYLALAAALGIELTGAAHDHDPPQDKDVTMTQDTRPARARAMTPGGQARVIAITIEKGGSAKTTTTVSLASLWGAAGLRVLIVDLDAQGHATMYSGLEKDGGALISALKGGGACETSPTEFGYDVVRGGPELDELPLVLGNARNPLTCVKKLMGPLRPEYDIILLDTAPSLDLRTSNAIVAADYVCIPVQVEIGAIDGLAELYEVLEELREDYPKVRLLGTIPTLVDRRCKEHVVNLRDLGRMEHLRTTAAHVPRSVIFAESFGASEPIDRFKPSSKAAKAYRKIADELYARIIARESSLVRAAGGDS